MSEAPNTLKIDPNAAHKTIRKEAKVVAEDTNMPVRIVANQYGQQTWILPSLFRSIGIPDGTLVVKIVYPKGFAKKRKAR